MLARTRNTMLALAVLTTAPVMAQTPGWARTSPHHYHAVHRHYAHHASAAAHSDGRPGAWCGWYMRRYIGADPGQAYNLAANWARYGSLASGPAVGAIVVWPHHVGMIVGQTVRGWLVHSGNDGHAVRTRERSVARAIAFRFPTGVWRRSYALAP